MTDHVARYRQLMAAFGSLNHAQPEAMEGFGRLHRGALAEGALARKTKELMALVIAVTQHCDGCITIHAHDAIHAGATLEEIDEAVAVAVLMGGGPAAVYGAQAREAAVAFADAEMQGDADRR